MVTVKPHPLGVISRSNWSGVFSSSTSGFPLSTKYVISGYVLNMTWAQLMAARPTAGAGNPGDFTSWAATPASVDMAALIASTGPAGPNDNSDGIACLVQALNFIQADPTILYPTATATGPGPWWKGWRLKIRVASGLSAPAWLKTGCGSFVNNNASGGTNYFDPTLAYAVGAKCTSQATGLVHPCTAPTVATAPGNFPAGASTAATTYGPAPSGAANAYWGAGVQTNQSGTVPCWWTTDATAIGAFHYTLPQYWNYLQVLLANCPVTLTPAGVWVAGTNGNTYAGGAWTTTQGTTLTLDNHPLIMAMCHAGPTTIFQEAQFRQTNCNKGTNYPVGSTWQSGGIPGVNNAMLYAAGASQYTQALDLAALRSTMAGMAAWVATPIYFSFGPVEYAALPITGMGGGQNSMDAALDLIKYGQVLFGPQGIAGNNGLHDGTNDIAGQFDETMQAMASVYSQLGSVGRQTAAAKNLVAWNDYQTGLPVNPLIGALEAAAMQYGTAHVELPDEDGSGNGWQSQPSTTLAYAANLLAANYQPQQSTITNTIPEAFLIPPGILYGMS